MIVVTARAWAWARRSVGLTGVCVLLSCAPPAPAPASPLPHEGAGPGASARGASGEPAPAAPPAAVAAPAGEAAGGKGPAARAVLRVHSRFGGSWALCSMRATALVIDLAPGPDGAAFGSGSRIEGDRLVPIEGFSRGLPRPGVNWAPLAAHGSFPDQAYLELTGWFELETDVPTGRVYRWGPGGWTQVYLTRHGTMNLGFAAVPGGGVGLTSYVLPDRPRSAAFRAFGKAARPAPATEGGKRLVEPEALFGGPGGALFVVGHGPGEAGPARLEVFPSGKSRGAVVDLPAAAGGPVAFGPGMRSLAPPPWQAAPGDEAAFVGGEAGQGVVVFSLERGRASALPPPPGGELVALAASGDGGLWVATRSPSRLFERAAEGAWAEVAVAVDAAKGEAVEITGLHAVSRDELWVMTHHGDSSTLLRSGPSPR